VQKFINIAIIAFEQHTILLNEAFLKNKQNVTNNAEWKLFNETNKWTQSKKNVNETNEWTESKNKNL